MLNWSKRKTQSKEEKGKAKEPVNVPCINQIDKIML